MLRIGDFSKLSQVSVKALRYYDDIGLLKPVSVDRFTGYRYYSADQMPRLNRILALKDLGFSLEQIAQLLDDGLSSAEIRGMLLMKQAEIRQQLDTEQARLARVEARLRQIEKEGNMPAYDVVLKKVEPQMVAGVRAVIPSYSDVGGLFGELFAYLGRRGVRPAGPPMAIYFDTEFKERDADVEAAIPIADRINADGRVSVRELPGAESTAIVVHHGSYETIGEAYTALMEWVQLNGYCIVGPIREVYLRGPESGGDPASYVTEVQIPVAKG
ncbi:MAG: MerR family transcriptional regulator [Chloroflexota bacterium]|nr:MAG: MerR family transcriptional regulator [Chloroflexota bacterium]